MRGKAEVRLFAANLATTTTLHDVEWSVGRLRTLLTGMHEVGGVAKVICGVALESTTRAELNGGTLGIHQLRLLDRVGTLLGHRLSDDRLLDTVLLEVVLRGQELLLGLNVLDLVAGEIGLAERSTHFSITD